MTEVDFGQTIVFPNKLNNSPPFLSFFQAEQDKKSFNLDILRRQRNPQLLSLTSIREAKGNEKNAKRQYITIFKRQEMSSLT